MRNIIHTVTQKLASGLSESSRVLNHLMSTLKSLLIFSFFLYGQKIQTATVELSKEQIASSSQLLEAAINALDGAFFSNADRILDIGCGDGQVTAFLAQKMPNSSIVGCDISKAMIHLASKKYNRNGYSNLRFTHKSAYKLGYKEEFDRVVSFNCLHWIGDQQTALNCMFQSLKTGGKVLLVASLKSEEDDLQISCSNLLSSEKWAFYFQDFGQAPNFRTEEEYKNLIGAAGFSIDRMHSEIHEVIFENRQSFENWISPLLIPMHHLHEKLRRPFLNDLMGQLEQRLCIDPEGKIHLHLGQIELFATKP